MISITHTPGPWMVAARPSSIVGWPVVAQGLGRSICSLSWLGKKPDDVTDEQFAAYRAEVEANGRLIAAAPDLLEALKLADAALREIYVRTGDLAAARAHDAAYEVIHRAGGQ